MQEKWRAQLAESIGAESKVALETDTTLLGGAEVRFPHAVVRLSVSDALAKLKESVSTQ
jgi:F0F1-type ATP synthase delta subunit